MQPVETPVTAPAPEPSTAWAASDAPPTDRSPVVDMIEVRLRTRSGYVMASRWAIIPPIETPTTCAESRPRAAISPAASAAMSASS